MRRPRRASPRRASSTTCGPTAPIEHGVARRRRRSAAADHGRLHVRGRRAHAAPGRHARRRGHPPPRRRPAGLGLRPAVHRPAGAGRDERAAGRRSSATPPATSGPTWPACWPSAATTSSSATPPTALVDELDRRSAPTVEVVEGVARPGRARRRRRAPGRRPRSTASAASTPPPPSPAASSSAASCARRVDDLRAVAHRLRRGAVPLPAGRRARRWSSRARARCSCSPAPPAPGRRPARRCTRRPGPGRTCSCATSPPRSRARACRSTPSARTSWTSPSSSRANRVDGRRGPGPGRGAWCRWAGSAPSTSSPTSACAVRRRHEPVHHRPVRRLRRRLGVSVSAPNEPDFGGRIGRTVPGVDAVVARPAGRARRPQRRADRARRHRLRPLRLLRLRAGHAQRSTGSPPTACATPASTPPRCARRRAPRCSPAATPTPSACGACRTGTPASRTCGAASRPRAATVAELLRRRTATPPTPPASGTWRRWRSARPPGPHTNWPLQKGFDRFYGFLQGETDQFHPELTSDNGHVDPPRRARGRLPRVRGHRRPGDRAGSATSQSIRPDRPFFLYLAFGATHAPHQAPAEYLRAVAGPLRRGLRRRARALVRAPARPRRRPAGHDAGAAQPRRAGVGRPHRQPAARSPPGCRRRSRPCSSTPTRRSAGSSTSSSGAGCSTTRCCWSCPTTARPARAARYGVMDEFSFFNGDVGGHRRDRRPPPRRHRRPALALELPVGLGPGRQLAAALVQAEHLRRRRARPARRALARTASPTRGDIRRQFCHAVDIAPTILEVTGVAGARRTCNGVPQMPDARRVASPPRSTTPTRRRRGRSSTSSRWATAACGPTAGRSRPTTSRASPSTTTSGACSTSTRTSPSATTSPAEHPEKLRELIDAWWVEAGSHGVLPLDDRTIELFGGAPRPGTVHARRDYVYLPPIVAHPRRRLARPSAAGRGRSPPRSTCPTAASRACSTPGAATTSATRSSCRTARCTSTTTRSAPTTGPRRRCR